jgi:hypothetical protein
MLDDGDMAPNLNSYKLPAINESMTQAAPAAHAKQNTIQVRPRPRLAQVGPLPDCDRVAIWGRDAAA